jgi:hypothetical protein
MLLMGKSTISIAIFNSKLLVYQRVTNNGLKVTKICGPLFVFKELTQRPIRSPVAIAEQGSDLRMTPARSTGDLNMGLIDLTGEKHGFNPQELVLIVFDQQKIGIKSTVKYGFLHTTAKLQGRNEIVG